MKPSLKLTTGLVLAAISCPVLHAQEPDAEIAGLEKAAENFVIAYNNRDAAALAALFTEDGEMTDLNAEDVTTGRDEIEVRYEELFASPDVPSVAIEVSSVRLVAPGIAVEDGLVHYTPPGDDEPARSTSYTAVLAKNGEGTWQVASTRNLGDATSPEGHLADLADLLKGDWTGQRDGMRIDVAFGWDDTGKYISGEMLATSPDAEPLTTSVRFGWDGAKREITCWTFDSGGGFASAIWTPEDDEDVIAWSVRTEGTTAEGEALSANQRLRFEDNNTFVWTAKDRVIDGESHLDTLLRMVRRAPEPGLDADTAATE